MKMNKNKISIIKIVLLIFSACLNATVISARGYAPHQTLEV